MIARCSMTVPMVLLAMTLLIESARAAEPGQPTSTFISTSGSTSTPTPASPTLYSAAGFYNLGNAYARAGKPGMAVLNYERAELLAPSDPDIEANLRFVRSGAHVPAEPVTAFEHYARRISPTLLAWLGLIGLVLAGASLVAGQWARGRAADPRIFPRRARDGRVIRRTGTRSIVLRRVALLVGITLVTLAVAQATVLWPRLQAAVVVTDSTPVRVSPVPMGDPLFTLPEAETVRASAQHEGFVLIRTRTGRTGWVSQNNVVPVLPRSGLRGYWSP